MSSGRPYAIVPYTDLQQDSICIFGVYHNLEKIFFTGLKLVHQL